MIPLDKINAVSGETGIFFGKIIIEDSASSCVITNVWKKSVIAFTNKTREAMNDIWRPRSTVPWPFGSGDDVISKLERLSALKASGVLTQEEFDKQKAIILE